MHLSLTLSTTPAIVSGKDYQRMLNYYNLKSILL